MKYTSEKNINENIYWIVIIINAEQQADEMRSACHSVGVFPCGYKVILIYEVWTLYWNNLEFWNCLDLFECHMKTYDQKLKNLHFGHNSRYGTTFLGVHSSACIGSLMKNLCNGEKTYIVKPM